MPTAARHCLMTPNATFCLRMMAYRCGGGGVALIDRWCHQLWNPSLCRHALCLLCFAMRRLSLRLSLMGRRSRRSSAHIQRHHSSRPCQWRVAMLHPLLPLVLLAVRRPCCTSARLCVYIQKAHQAHRDLLRLIYFRLHSNVQRPGDRMRCHDRCTDFNSLFQLFELDRIRTGCLLRSSCNV